MSARLLVIAKEPVPGRVKTRLCPPCTPGEAARIAAAALADTIDVVDATPAVSRTLVLDGAYPVPPGWATVAQRGSGLADRLVHAFADTGNTPGFLIGMDTPQISPVHLASAARLLDDYDAVLGPAADGGWWGLGLREPIHAEALRPVPTSTAETGARTLTALRRAGLRVALLPELRDVDTAADALAVAAMCAPGSRFAAAVSEAAR
jgi:rSAM/selenodomain-associated transferase 1